MKKLFFTSLTVFFWILLFGPSQILAQKKPSTKSEAEKMMEELDPEEIEMMKKMGIKFPDLSMISGDFDDSDEAKWQIPSRDESRIAKAKKVSLNQAELPAYLKNVHSSIATKLGGTRTSSANEMMANSPNVGEKAHLANGLWMFGMPDYAILVLGNAVQTAPQNPDYLNNYAAFLTMAGAEEAALPILKYLNSRYPKNSTVLNNLAQAWFGLGDLPTAEAYLDSAIRLYAYHSQANLTKGIIEERKGNRTAAAESLKKSLKSGYNPDKEDRISELGHKVTPNDLRWQPPLNEDPLGLVHMNWPKYPQNVFESEALEKEWEAYRSEINAQAEAISQRNEELTESFLESSMNDPLTRMTGGRMDGGGPITQLVFAPKAQALRRYYEENDERFENQKYEELIEEINTRPEKLYYMEKEVEKQIEELDERFKGRIGEGASDADRQAYCEAWNEIQSAHLRTVNAYLEEGNAKWIDYHRKKLSREMNYNRFTLLPEEYEMTTLDSKALWLGIIGGQEVEFTSPNKFCEYNEVPARTTGKLADFYDLNCKEKSKLNMVVGSITLECNKMTTELDSKFLKFKIRENMDTNEIIQGSVEIGFDVDLAEPSELGPVKAELKGELSGFIEFDGEGITDVGVKAGAKATFGTNLGDITDNKASLGFSDDPSLTLIGAEARWGWNSGPSLKGKSLLGEVSLLSN
ncbi:tetratricopeptide repeat protein [Mariniradius sediminis]|uniref:Tetratricopeptide repeat-containing protein n=1 Tax=Mariniradius sediminis TaxID=2909237 RepID=A0ABS9BT25_9BACT|nr:hypothetical protein [Mariniradius sediminis]MCF1751173.1 hypothetical protein [Mariniradius sediminis]